MAYSDIHTAANDPAFQGRCQAAVWDIAQSILIDPAIAQNDGTPLNTLDCKNYALKILRDQSVVSAKQIAIQILRNTTINASYLTATDSDIQWQTKEVWFDLMDIG